MSPRKRSSASPASTSSEDEMLKQQDDQRPNKAVAEPGQSESESESEEEDQQDQGFEDADKEKEAEEEEDKEEEESKKPSPQEDTQISPSAFTVMPIVSKLQPKAMDESAKSKKKHHPKRPAKGQGKKSGKEPQKKRSRRVSIGHEEKSSSMNRLWSEADELAILRGVMEFRRNTGFDPSAAKDGFHKSIKKSLHVEVSTNQLMDKLRRLKNKYHDNKLSRKASKLSKKIWASGAGACGGEYAGAGAGEDAKAGAGDQDAKAAAAACEDAKAVAAASEDAKAKVAVEDATAVLGEDAKAVAVAGEDAKGNNNKKARKSRKCADVSGFVVSSLKSKGKDNGKEILSGEEEGLKGGEGKGKEVKRTDEVDYKSTFRKHFLNDSLEAGTFFSVPNFLKDLSKKRMKERMGAITNAVAQEMVERQENLHREGIALYLKQVQLNQDVTKLFMV